MKKNTAKKIVIANWKMNPNSTKEAERLFKNISKNSSKIRKTNIVVCVPFIYLESLKKISKKIILGAQDAFYGDLGAFTGEISSNMLEGVGVKYVILGHSERRSLGEDNVIINKKLKSVLDASVVPILCVGEENRDQNHEYFNVVEMQITDCLRGINKNLFSKIIIAYEPVWALSTTVNRRDATSLDMSEMVIFIRKVLSDLSNSEIANKVKIIYGGSVTERDAEDFLKNGGVDGLLVGKMSLDAKKFTKIIEITEKLS